jgi:hypothetical protein
MSRQVRAVDKHVVCDVCRRTILKGERPEHYLAPSRERKLVCELCGPRAQREGWIREAAAPAMPAQPPRQRDARRLFRLSRRRPVVAGPSRDGGRAENGSGPARDEEGSADEARARRGTRRFRRQGGHVRAVPTSAQLKVSRAVDLFNDSEHPRTISGIARTLGEPRVSAVPSTKSTAEVVITVAWDISWYQFAIDLADADQPVRMESRGSELSELADEAREWNASAEEDGTVSFERSTAAEVEQSATADVSNGDATDPVL